MRIRKLLTAAALFALSCTSTRIEPHDEWARPAPKDLASRLYKSQERSARPVAPGSRESSITRLRPNPLVRLSLKEAEDLAGQALSEGNYFLLRGLCVGCGTGYFKVYSDGENVLVSHFSLAKPGRRPTQWPVIANLERNPDQVFVECGFAE
jgi:hypothetical protein